MKLSDISIKRQLVLLGSSLIISALLISGVSNYLSVKNIVEKQINNLLSVQSAGISSSIDSYYSMSVENLENIGNAASMAIIHGIATARVIEVDQSETVEIEATNQNTLQKEKLTIPLLKINQKQILYDYDYVDKLRNKFDAEFTIFQLIPKGLLRVSTSIVRDNNRAVNTYIPTDSPVYNTIITGKSYLGRAIVLGENYLSSYEPIRNPKGEIVGALFSGIAETKITNHLLEGMKNLVIGKTGYVFIFDSKGSYVLSQGRKSDGKNVLEVKDAAGRPIIKEMIDLAKNLKPEETTIYPYSWKNEGEKVHELRLLQ